MNSLFLMILAAAPAPPAEFGAWFARTDGSARAKCKLDPKNEHLLQCELAWTTLERRLPNEAIDLKVLLETLTMKNPNANVLKSAKESCGPNLERLRRTDPDRAADHAALCASPTPETLAQRLAARGWTESSECRVSSWPKKLTLSAQGAHRGVEGTWVLTEADDEQVPPGCGRTKTTRLEIGALQPGLEQRASLEQTTAPSNPALTCKSGQEVPTEAVRLVAIPTKGPPRFPVAGCVGITVVPELPR
ncbi:MAG: hypothetical protein HY906_08285 [Deltaproteobacteria bacterium]|nr:hypothetical protein [Deltaproteobacteria bacterium]